MLPTDLFSPIDNLLCLSGICLFLFFEHLEIVSNLKKICTIKIALKTNKQKTLVDNGL